MLIIIPIFVGNAWAQHLQSFLFNGKNGSNPKGGLVVDSAGNFYGSTFWGENIYRINLTSEATLYNFSDSNGDGQNPIGDLILDSAGNLYGVTQAGGYTGGACTQTSGCGTVFELSPPASVGGAWTETVLHTFQATSSSDGASPEAGLLFDSAGNLYGTTVYGGTNDLGTVFELMPPSQPGGTWTESILYSFGQGAGDGVNPSSQLIFDQQGNLYGTTELGANSNNGGMIFELSPPLTQGGAWTESALHRFSRADGDAPVAGLTWGPDGALFGTAAHDGPNGGGTVFRLSPPSGKGGWTYYVLYSFPKAAGFPAARVIFNGSNVLYGTTVNGANVFQISYSGGRAIESVLAQPGASYAGVVLYEDALYGVTIGSDLSQLGTVYRLSH